VILTILVLTSTLYTPRYLGSLDMDGDRRKERITARFLGWYPKLDISYKGPDLADVRIEIRSGCGKVESVGILYAQERFPTMVGYSYWPTQGKDCRGRPRNIRRDPIITSDTGWYAITKLKGRWTLVSIPPITEWSKGPPQ